MSKISDINSSDLYGIIIESGCGAAIAHKFLMEPGASNTIHFCKVPYSKVYQKNVYDVHGRSVDFELCKLEITKERQKHEKDGINFIIASTAQLSDNQPDRISHAFIGIWHKSTNTEYYFHVTFFEQAERDVIANALGEKAVELLHKIEFGSNMTEGKHSHPLFNTIDIAYVVKDGSESINWDFLYNQFNYLDSSALVFRRRNNKLESCRVADLARTGDSFVVAKGSFNPVHKQHYAMVKYAMNLYPGSTPVFLISIKNYDKPQVELDDLIRRIEQITSLGVYVVVLKDFEFYSNFDSLRKIVPNGKFHFVVGTDTMNRICDLDVSMYKKCGVNKKDMRYFIGERIAIHCDGFEFIVYPRLGYTLHKEIPEYYQHIIKLAKNFVDDGTSSTKIRNGKIKNTLLDDIQYDPKNVQ